MQVCIGQPCSTDFRCRQQGSVRCSPLHLLPGPAAVAAAATALPQPGCSWLQGVGKYAADANAVLGVLELWWQGGSGAAAQPCRPSARAGPPVESYCAVCMQLAGPAQPWLAVLMQVVGLHCCQPKLLLCTRAALIALMWLPHMEVFLKTVMLCSGSDTGQ